MRCEKSLAHRLCEAAAIYCRSVQVLERTQCTLPPWLPQTVRLLRTLSEGPEQLVALNTLRDNPGATHSVRVRIAENLLLLQALPESQLLCSLSVLAGEPAQAWAKLQAEDTRGRRPEQVPFGKSNVCSCKGLSCKPQSMMLCIPNSLLLETCAQLRP